MEHPPPPPGKGATHSGFLTTEHRQDGLAGLYMISVGWVWVGRWVCVCMRSKLYPQRLSA